MRPSRLLVSCVCLSLSACLTDAAEEATANVVNVDLNTMAFAPASVRIRAGQTVRWTWRAGLHNVVSGSNCQPDGAFSSGELMSSGTFDRVFDRAGSYPYYCAEHCSLGMVGEVEIKN